MEFRAFEPTIFQFLEELADNNNRPWFQENKHRYEAEVFEPAMAFIRAFRPRLAKLSPYFVAADRRVGGSLMRVYRDTRFFQGEPYKTNVGIQFRHEMGRDVHAPGFYVHIAPGECFLAMGVWHPDRETLAKIRQAIVERPDRWRRAARSKEFCARFELSGESLARAPRGFPADHPLVDDLRRTDFVGYCDMTEKEVLSARFPNRVAESFAASRPLVRFLCEALRLPF